MGEGKDKDNDKHKGTGKAKICPFFINQGCHDSSACKILHEAPAMAAPIPAPKAEAAAVPNAAAAPEPAKP